MDEFFTPLAGYYCVAGLLVGLLFSRLGVEAKKKQHERDVILACEPLEAAIKELRLANARLKTKLVSLKPPDMTNEGSRAETSDLQSLVLQLQAQLRMAHKELEKIKEGTPIIGVTLDNDDQQAHGFAQTRPFEY